MKKGFQSNIPEFFFSGKSILITIVILISGFSFGLGYLVGKKSDNFSDRKLVERKTDVPPVPPVSPDDFDRTVDTIIKQDLELSGNVEHPPVSTTALTKVKAPKSASSQNTGTTIYSIQVGAFKRLSDAERLKKRLDNKGFNSYILSVRLKKGTLYKVRAGRYDKKSEAEEYASEIKKMKGLDAFVLIEK